MHEQELSHFGPLNEAQGTENGIASKLMRGLARQPFSFYTVCKFKQLKGIRIMSTVSKVLEKKSGEILSVSSETVVFDAIEKMAQLSAGTALVMDGEQLIGIISERDFLRKVYLSKKYDQGVTVGEIMSTELTTVTPDEQLESCMTIMTSKRIRHLPVVENGKVLGILSIGDIVKYLVDEKDFEIKNLQSYISGPGL